MIDIFTFKENELYGSDLPETDEDLELIKQHGIKIIISLEESFEKLKHNSQLLREFEHYELYITDYDIPTKEQAEEFLGILEKARKERKPVLVHCYAGCGRTGLLLALAEKIIYGEVDGFQAIENVRKIRPCAVENMNQVVYVYNYTRD